MNKLTITFLLLTVLAITLACELMPVGTVTNGTFRVKDDVYLANTVTPAPTTTVTPTAPRPHGWIATKRAGGKP